MQRDGIMHPYPKQIFTLQQQIQSYVDAGMVIEPNDSAEDVLTRIGYYRLRGYCFHLYDNSTKQYASGTKFSDVVSLLGQGTVPRPTKKTANESRRHGARSQSLPAPYFLLFSLFCPFSPHPCPHFPSKNVLYNGCSE